MEIDEKYNYDIAILNIDFRFRTRGEIIKEPKIIILCEKVKYLNNDEYDLYYFNFNFIVPNNYFINLSTRNVSRANHENYAKSYDGWGDANYPMPMELKISQVKETYSNHQLFHYEFIFNNNSDKNNERYISIYAKDLIIEDVPEPEFITTAEKMELI